MTADAPMEYDLFKLSGLKWEDIDIENNQLTVKRSIQRIPVYEKDKLVRYEVVEQTPKTENSYRTNNIPKTIVAKLKAYKKQQNKHILRMWADYNNLNYVFCDPMGNSINRN